MWLATWWESLYTCDHVAMIIYKIHIELAIYVGKSVMMLFNGYKHSHLAIGS